MIKPEDFHLLIDGIPGPKGSRKFAGFTPAGRPILAEDCPKVKPWADAIVFTSKLNMADRPIPAFSGPVELEVWFYLEPPKRMPKGRMYPTVTPDLDKLARATLDPLKVARVLSDDAIVVDLLVYKRYAGVWTPYNDPPRPYPGASIRIMAK
jgi:Holliday junction resolvase RusA-like endonuclease